MLQPKKSKYRKQFRGKNRGKAYRGNELAFAEFGLKAVTGGWVSAREIEAARKKITYVTERVGRYWIRVFPDKPITKKPAETRMGSGKGSPEWWIANVKPGRVLFEMTYPNEEIAREALRRAMHKLPCKCRIVTREEQF